MSKIFIFKQGIISISALIAICLLPYSAQAGVTIGQGEAFPGHQYLQWWDLIDEEDPKQYIKGEITRIQRNCCEYFDDGDWNIFIRPDSEYSELLENSHGEINSDEVIEAEICTWGIDLTEFYPGGTRVEAFGWWVEDYGHTQSNPKTELHPLIYIKKQESPSSFTFFTAQDVSSRFTTAGQDIYLAIPINIDVEPQIINPLSRQTTANNAKILKEEATVDNFYYREPEIDYLAGHNEFDLPEDYWPNYWKELQTNIQARQTVGNVTIYPHLRPAAPWFIDHFYLGRFSILNSENLLWDRVSTRVEKDFYDGVGLIRITVNAELRTPKHGYDPIAFSSWYYDESISDGITARRFIEKRSDHQIQYQLIYSPELGWSRTSWGLDVIGSTRTPEWYPCIRTNQYPAAGVKTENRVFVEDRRIYQIIPSNLSLRAQNFYNLKPTKVICEGESEGIQFKGIDGITINPIISKVHPDVEVTLNWQIKAPKQNWELIPENTTKKFEGFTVRNVHNKQLIIIYAYEILPDQSFDIQVVVSGQSDVGERLRAKAEVRRPAQGWNFRDVLSDDIVVKMENRYFRIRPANIIKTLVAVYHLNKRGIPIEPWPKQQLKSFWSKSLEFPFEPYKLYRMLPKEWKFLMQDYAEVVAGNPVDKKRLKRMIDAIALTAHLPDLSVPKGLFEIRQKDLRPLKQVIPTVISPFQQ